MMTMLHSVWSGGESAAGRRRSLLALGALLALVASVLVWAAPTQAQSGNLPPVAIALTPTVSGTPGSGSTATMTIRGDLSYDPDDGNAAACHQCKYKWEVVTTGWKFLAGFAGTTFTAANAQITVTNVNLEALSAVNGTVIEFKLTVTDSKGDSDTDTATYNIMTSSSPTADISLSAMLADPDAAADATTAEKYTIDAVIDGPGENGNADNEWDIMEGALLELDGSGSSDPDGDTLNYKWVLEHETGTTASDGNFFPRNDDPATNTSSTLPTDVTTAKLSTDGGADDANKTVGRLNVSLAQDAVKQPTYNVIYTLAVTDSGERVDDSADATNNVDDTALVRIVIHDQPADPTVSAKIEDTNRLTANVIEGGAVAGGSANVLAPPSAGRYQVIPDSDTTTDLVVILTATAYDADADTDDDGTHVVRSQTTKLLTGNDGSETAPAITWSSDDLKDSAIAEADDATASNAKTATVTIPATAKAGDTFTVTATVAETDVSTPITLVVAEKNQRPVSTILTGTTATPALADVVTDTTQRTALGNFGITQVLDVKPVDGVYTVDGFGFDSDGSVGVVNWTQLIDNEPAEADHDDYVPLTGAFSNTVSFGTPENDKLTWVLLSYTVIDDTGAFDTDYGVVSIAAAPSGQPAANAGDDQVVSPESTVVLAASASGFDADDTPEYVWTIKSVSTTPGPEDLSARASTQVHKDLNSFLEVLKGEDLAGDTDTDITAIGEILSAISGTTGGVGAFQYFTAPKLSAGLKYAQITFNVAATAEVNDTDATKNDEVTITVATDFFSSYIDNPDYCYNKSLGGMATQPHDSTGDGAADVCSLPYTRREAVARQNALQQLADLGSTIDVTDTADTPRTSGATLTDLVMGRTGKDAVGNVGDANYEPAVSAVVGTCTKAKKLASAPDDPDACDDDATKLTSPPGPVDPALAGVWYSGVVTGPEFCTNFSLGGARLYADDPDGDGVADICSLHTTRREAIAVQLALEMFEAHSQFENAFKAACTALGSETFDESAAALAADACSVGLNPQSPGKGTPLP